MPGDGFIYLRASVETIADILGEKEEDVAQWLDKKEFEEEVVSAVRALDDLHDDYADSVLAEAWRRRRDRDAIRLPDTPQAALLTAEGLRKAAEKLRAAYGGQHAINAMRDSVLVPVMSSGGPSVVPAWIAYERARCSSPKTCIFPNGCPDQIHAFITPTVQPASPPPPTPPLPFPQPFPTSPGARPMALIRRWFDGLVQSYLVEVSAACGQCGKVVHATVRDNEDPEPYFQRMEGQCSGTGSLPLSAFAPPIAPPPDLGQQRKADDAAKKAAGWKGADALPFDSDYD